MVKVFHCSHEVSEFELESRYYVYFRTNTLGLNRLLRFFNKDVLGIK